MPNKFECPSCEKASGLPLHGGFSRRRFLKIAGTGLVASYFADVVDPALVFSATAAGPSLKNTAKSCIFIFLSGAPSQIDMWDLKEGPWTPADFAPATVNGTRWPQGLLPKTADHLGRLDIVRCGMAWAAVHPLARGWSQIARNPGGATGAISPHIGAVVALESQSSRAGTDVLPGFLAINTGSIPGSGYLPAKYAPFAFQPSPDGLATLVHPQGEARLTDRWNFLQRLDLNRQTGSLGKSAMDMKDFYDEAKSLMDSPRINDLFSFNEAERIRYGTTAFGDSLIVARNIVHARKGTRFVQVGLGGWDHHSDIYNRASLYALCAEFDTAFGALLSDLASLPGSIGGTTQLDETLIVVVSEFGRTVGPLNGQGGRDHFLRNSIVFAGGGVRGGRTIGKTDDRGDAALEYEWSANRDVRPEDVTCTIYSALGIDYTTMRTDDPAGQGFEYVPFARDGAYRPIDELF